MESSGLLPRSAAGIHHGRTPTWGHGPRCRQESGVGSLGHDGVCSANSHHHPACWGGTGSDRGEGTMSKRTITYSEMRSRRRCPYQGHLAYDELLTPKVKSPGLREGTIADQGMDALYLGVRDYATYAAETMLEAMREATARDRAVSYTHLRAH